MRTIRIGIVESCAYRCAKGLKVHYTPAVCPNAVLITRPVRLIVTSYDYTGVEV